MTDAELELIRERDRAGFVHPAIVSAQDRRDLLAEVDRLRSENARLSASVDCRDCLRQAEGCNQ